MSACQTAWCCRAKGHPVLLLMRDPEHLWGLVKRNADQLDWNQITPFEQFWKSRSWIYTVGIRIAIFHSWRIWGASDQDQPCALTICTYLHHFRFLHQTISTHTFQYCVFSLFLFCYSFTAYFLFRILYILNSMQIPPLVYLHEWSLFRKNCGH